MYSDVLELLLPSNKEDLDKLLKMRYTSDATLLHVALVNVKNVQSFVEELIRVTPVPAFNEWLVTHSQYMHGKDEEKGDFAVTPVVLCFLQDSTVDEFCGLRFWLC